MSFPTQPAYIHTGTWNETSRSHECLNFMEKYTNAIDAKEWDTVPYSKWFTSDHVLQKSTGEIVSGGDASWSCLSKEIYAPFSAHLHDPTFAAVWETENGWELVGGTTLYWNLVVPGEGAKVKDERKGREWDGAVPAAFKFKYRKEGGGIKLASSTIFTDPTAAVVAMLKRGMMKPEDLLK